MNFFAFPIFYFFNINLFQLEAMIHELLNEAN